MNSSLTIKILFSFILIAFLGILGNVFMSLKFGDIASSSKSILESEEILFIAREVEENIEKERYLINKFLLKQDTALYNKFIIINREFYSNIEKMRSKLIWADTDIRNSLNHIVAEHNDLVAKFNTRIMESKILRKFESLSSIQNEISALNRGFIKLKVLLEKRIRGNLANIEDASIFMSRIALFFLIFTSLISVLMCVWITRSILTPLRKLNLGIKKVGKGEFDKTIKIGKADEEIREILIAFKDMSYQLQKYRDNLIETERFKAVDLIATSVSHEVNNPLMIINGIAELILSTQGKIDKSLKENMDMIINEVKRIASITKKLNNIKQIVLDDYSMKSEGGLKSGEIVNIVNSSKELEE